jgi:hypothetical protein
MCQLSFYQTHIQTLDSSVDTDAQLHTKRLRSRDWIPTAVFSLSLTLIPLTWRIWWASNNASRWQMGFNSAFKGLKRPNRLWDQLNSLPDEYQESFVGPNGSRAWRLFRLWKRGATSPLPSLVSVTFIHCAICGHAVAQLVEALRYNGDGFDSRWCHWDFSLT